MNCIFCKAVSDNSKSVEHIIPESLGNKDYVLPKGIVCDKCNNYFSNKIERPLLDLPYFVSVRHRNMIESKKGRIPIERGVIIADDGYKVNFHIDKNGRSLSFEDEQAYRYLIEHKRFTVIVLANESPPKNNPHISRFLAKVAVEALAKIGLTVEGGIQHIVENTGLDPIRNYARFGTGTKFWEYHLRPIYQEAHSFIDESSGEPYEVLHEFHLFQTQPNLWHLALAIFGFEYCIDLTAPDTDSYIQWLQENDNISPLNCPKGS